eukprot:227096-Amorphochlora_amoeboformis.AAC.1
MLSPELLPRGRILYLRILFSEAIRSLGSVLRKPSVMVPHISTPNVNSIPFRALKSAGIKVVVFDKDNTITAPYSFE